MTVPARIDRFVVERLLGKGGMGEVYLAFDPKLRRHVALKLLSTRTDLVPELTTPQTLDLRDTAVVSESRLLREAQAMAQLSHPNVVPVYEIGSTDDGLFLVAEYVEGPDLASWLGDQPIAERIELLRQAGHGLLAAHASGIIHRDFKLANVLVGSDGRARVTDFGIAIQQGRDPLIRVAQRKAGTPGYMAPEVERGLDATPASDVYSYCAAFVRAITGARADDSAAEIERALQSQDVDAAISSAVASGCSADPAARPDLAALIALMEPTSSRRWLWPAAVGVAAIAMAGMTIALVAGRDNDDHRCAPWDELAQVWTAEKQSTIASAFALTDLAESQKVADKTAQLISGYTTALAETKRLACKLPDPEGAVLGCLTRRLARLEASVEALSDEPNRSFVKAAPSFLWQLPDPKTCLQATGHPPTEIELGHERRLVRVRADLRARRKKSEVLAALETLAADVSKGPAAMRGEVEYTRGQFLIDTNAPPGDALEHFNRAHELALEAGDDALAVRCLTNLGRLTGLDAKKHDDGLKFARMANAQAVRAKVGPLERAQVLEALAGLTGKVGRLDEAVGHFEQALSVIEESSYLNVYVRGRIRRAFSAILAKVGRVDDELRYLELAADDYTKALGENNSLRATVIAQLGSRLLLDKEHERGRELLQEAKRALEASEGSHHVRTMKVRTALVAELFAGGRYDEAHRELLALAGGFPSAVNRSNVEGMAAVALNAMARHDEALVLLRRVIATLESTIGKDKPILITFYRSMADAELGLGNLDAADAALVRAEMIFREKTPDDTKTAAGLTANRARLTERKSGCSAALSLFEAATELRPSSERFRDVGHCLVKTGKLERGSEALERALVDVEGVGDAKRMAVARIERTLGYARHKLGDASGIEMFRRSEAVLREHESWYLHILDDGLAIED